MATYTVGANDVGVGAWTLVAGQVDTVTFEADILSVRVVSDGVAEVMVTFDGSTPTMPAAGASTKGVRLPAGIASVLEVPLSGATDSVKILSSGTPKVSVEKAL